MSAVSRQKVALHSHVLAGKRRFSRKIYKMVTRESPRARDFLIKWTNTKIISPTLARTPGVRRKHAARAVPSPRCLPDGADLFPRAPQARACLSKRPARVFRAHVGSRFARARVPIGSRPRLIEKAPAPRSARDISPPRPTQTVRVTRAPRSARLFGAISPSRPPRRPRAAMFSRRCRPARPR